MNTLNDAENAAWSEYDSAADWCASRGLRGLCGDPLPPGLSVRAKALIDFDPEAFSDRVRGFAYARAMAGQPDYST